MEVCFTAYAPIVGHKARLDTVQLWTANASGACVRECVCVTYTMCTPSVRVFILPSDLYPPAPVGLDGDGGGVRQLVRP